VTTYYVGPGGSDGANGKNWGQRKLTLNGAEDIAVVAGDTVYVGSGVYREQLTCDVSGASGNPITYIGDVTGENTDGVGGIVRITGSDNDQTAARQRCINGTNQDYRTFRGFSFDTTTDQLILGSTDTNNWIVEDCTFQNAGLQSIRVTGDNQTGWIIRRCDFLFSDDDEIIFISGSGVDNAGHVVESCVFTAAATLSGRGITCDDVGGITIRNCNFAGLQRAILTTALGGGAPVANVVNNSVFYGNRFALWATNLGDMTENHNNLHANETDRTNVAVGAGSTTYPLLLLPPLLSDGFVFPYKLGALSQWSQVRAIAGTNEPSTDFYGLTRPTSPTEKSWGAVQFFDVLRGTTVTRGGSEASLVLRGPGRSQMWVPVDGIQTTINVYTYRLAGYSSPTNPQMIIKQPGQADRITTDVGAAGAWNLLTDTFTPAVEPPYVVVELVSSHIASTTSTSTTTSTTTSTSLSSSTTVTGTSISTSTTSTSLSTSTSVSLSTSTTSTSTSTTSTSVSTSTTSTSHSTSTTTLAHEVYFDDLGVN